MSNNSGDIRRSFGIRNRASSQSNISRARPQHHGEFVEINLELMDPAIPGRQVNSNDTTRVGSDDIPASLLQSRWKRMCQAVSRPFVRSYRATKLKLRQPSDGKVGWKRTTFILLTEQVGLALGLAPFVYNQLGYIGATLTYLLVAFLAYRTNMILFKYKRHDPEITSICDVAGKLFGNLGRVLTLIFLTLCSTMIAAAHIREGGDFITIASKNMPRAEYIWRYTQMCPEIVGTVVTGLLILMVALPRNFRLLSVASMVTVPLTILSVCGALGVLWGDESDASFPFLRGTGPRAFGSEALDGEGLRPSKASAVLCVVFSFLIHPTSPAIMFDMKNVNHFPVALASSTLVQVSLFCLLGLLGYIMDGVHDMVGTVFDSLPNDKLSIAFYGMIQPSVILQAGLFVNVLGRELLKLGSADLPRTGPNAAGRFTSKWLLQKLCWVLILSIQVFGAWLFAGSFANLSALVGLVAAIPGAFFFFSLPACVTIYKPESRDLPFARHTTAERRKIRWAIFGAGMLILGGILISVWGTWASWSFFRRNAHSSYAEVLNPFACVKNEKKGNIIYPGETET